LKRNRKSWGASIKKLALRDDRMQIAECRKQIQKMKIGRRSVKEGRVI